MAPPPRRPRSTLPEELVEEILIRIPPDEPAHLLRAALVCKPWRRIILSDADFLRRYRAFHRRRPPLLGFFYNEFADHGVRPSFMPAAAAFPSVPPRYRLWAWRILDCRDGRVLLETLYDEHDRIIVWDPISGDRQKLKLREDGMCCQSYCVVVLCAVTGCNHHNCRGGPFLVVYLGADATDDTIVKACVYSSEDCAWGTPVSYQLDRGCYFYFDNHRAAVIGDEIYCVVTPGARIIKYDLVKHCISSFSSPPMCREASRYSPPLVGDTPVLMQNKDGSLGLASVRDSRLHLWSSSRMVVNRWGKIVAEWEQMSVIVLDKILPIDKPCVGVYVAGFVEGVGVLLIRTDDGTFTFELNSGRVRKISMSSIDFHTAFPFISFFTLCKAPTALY